MCTDSRRVPQEVQARSAGIFRSHGGCSSPHDALKELANGRTVCRDVIRDEMVFPTAAGHAANERVHAEASTTLSQLRFKEIEQDIAAENQIM